MQISTRGTYGHTSTCGNRPTDLWGRKGTSRPRLSGFRTGRRPRLVNLLDTRLPSTVLQDQKKFGEKATVRLPVAWQTLASRRQHLPGNNRKVLNWEVELMGIRRRLARTSTSLTILRPTRGRVSFLKGGKGQRSTMVLKYAKGCSQ